MIDDRGLKLRWEDPLLRLAADVARGMNYLHKREHYDEISHSTKKCIIRKFCQRSAVLNGPIDALCLSFMVYKCLLVPLKSHMFIMLTKLHLFCNSRSRLKAGKYPCEQLPFGQDNGFWNLSFLVPRCVHDQRGHAVILRSRGVSWRNL